MRKAAITWEPHPYQKRAIEFLLRRGAAALWLDPGLGKTAIALYAFKTLLEARVHHRMLVVAPLRVCWQVWPREVQKWKQFKDLRLEVIHGPHKERVLDIDADIFCVNYEGLAWLLEKGRLRKLGADVILVDESTKIKNTSSMRFKMLRPIWQRFSRRWELTGTPSPNGLLDVFGQIFALDLGSAFGPYITHFRNEYFDQHGFDYTLKDGAEERIYEKLRPLVLRMEARDYLDLPEVIYNDIKVALPSEAMRAYTEMENKLLTMLADGTEVSAVSKGVAAQKCLQIANGGVYTRDDFNNRITNHIHTAKVDALEDLVEEISGKPALVFYSFDHDLERLKKAFPKAACVAELSAKKADAMFDRWNNGEIDMVLAQPQSMAHGLNLQEGGQHIIWYGMPWDLEIYIQAIDRLCRQGSKFKHIFVHHLLGENTIDVDVRWTLVQKDRTQAALLNAMKTRRMTVGRPTKLRPRLKRG